MTSDWQRVRALFEQASELAPAARPSWLAAQTGGDAELRRQVERLLAATDSDERFLQPPGDATLASGVPAVELPRQLGPFRLFETIGRGGMGTVVRAVQDHPQREVAVKVLHGGLATARRRERFHAEIDALARLQHPGIAQVFEAGVEADGTAWFAMELLRDALPVTQRARIDGLGLTARLAQFVAICDAVQHAHQRGVIHRDLKPANLLARPDGAVKVIDFGIARVLDADAAHQTAAGELLGTLAYMSPEQIEGRETDVRTDVYGLGVVLYELVAERRPFDLDGVPFTAACRILVERDAPPVRRDAPALPLELDWILGRALRKDPAARYASVAEFADDVVRCLRHEPLLAAPPGPGYRVRKFVRRHRLAVAAAAIVLTVSVAAFATTAVALVRTQRAEAAEREGRRQAEDASRRATAALEFLLGVFSTVDPGKEGRDVKMADALARTAADFDRRLEDSPSIRAALGRTIGMAFFGLGMLSEAEQQLRRSLVVHEQCFGPGHVKTAQVAVDLSEALSKRGQLDEADAVLARAEAVAADLPPGDQLRIATQVRRGDLLRARGDKAAAAAMLRPVVQRLEDEQPGARQTLIAENQLAGILHELGDLDAAEPLYRAALAGFAARGEQEHPESLAATNNLLMLLHSRGRRAEMLPMLEELLLVRSRVLGEKHPDTIATLSNLGGIHFTLENCDDAARCFRDALDRLGPGVDDRERLVQTLLSNLAAAEGELGHFAEASALGERVLRSRESTLGTSHEAALMTLALVADLRRQAGEPDAAIAMFADGAARAEAATPPQWPNLYRCLIGIGRCHLDRQDYAAAEAVLLRSREVFDRAEATNAGKGQLLRPEPLLLKLYTAWGKPEQAAQFAGQPDAAGVTGK